MPGPMRRCRHDAGDIPKMYGRRYLRYREHKSTHVLLTYMLATNDNIIRTGLQRSDVEEPAQME